MAELWMPLLANVVVASLVWLLACWRRDVSLVDLIWPLFFVLSAWIWFEPGSAGGQQWLVLALVMAWGGRLHIYLARRNLGHGEDRRYQEIRRNNSPGFWWKSYFIVFLLQAVIAWFVALVIFAALRVEELAPLRLLGACVALFGLVYEAVADRQLSRFKAMPGNSGKVMDAGLWRYSRHPNYFGECCFWWGLYLMALPAGWWALLSPLVMTLLLLKVSGVSLLEKDIHERRPAYRDYVRKTPAFVPNFARADLSAASTRGQG